MRSSRKSIPRPAGRMGSHDHVRHSGEGTRRRPEAARDVGQAMAQNPVALIIPVTGSGGRRQGRRFSAPGGSAAKIRMLKLEASTSSRPTGPAILRVLEHVSRLCSHRRLRCHCRWASCCLYHFGHPDEPWGSRLPQPLRRLAITIQVTAPWQAAALTPQESGPLAATPSNNTARIRNAADRLSRWAMKPITAGPTRIPS